MERNLPLLRKTIDYINAHPEEHNQYTWNSPCGTSFCFAGHAAILNGLDYDETKKGFGWFLDGETGKHLSEEESDEFYQNGKPYEHISDYAQRELGLTSEEKAYMFSSGRSRAELNEAVTLMEQGAVFDEDEWCFVLRD